jgi:short-subunit dehydrogenase
MAQTLRHVAITGASSGLGRALAELYAAPGVTLSLSGRNRERLEATAAACRARSADADARCVDVTDPAAMHDWLTGRDAAAPIDLLIANAGIGGSAVVPGPSGEAGGMAREIFAINTLGVINAVTPILPRMIARRGGQLVLVSSMNSYLGFPQAPAYSASKAAVRIYGEGLRRLVRRHGVRVTTVMPGFIDTPMSQTLGMRRPFCWPADVAARRIARDVARGAAECVFPWQLRLSTGLSNYLPLAVTDFILAMTTRMGWDNRGDRDIGGN